MSDHSGSSERCAHAQHVAAQLICKYRIQYKKPLKVYKFRNIRAWIVTFREAIRFVRSFTRPQASLKSRHMTIYL